MILKTQYVSISNYKKLLAIICLTYSLGLVSKANSQSRFPSQLATDLQFELDNWAKDSNHIGVSASVILKDGSQWTGTSGISALGKDLKEDELIWIASITKTITGAIILKLYEENKLSLNDSIAQWLPVMKNIDPKITIKQLLNHTNGLSNYTRNPKLSKDIQNDSTHIFTANELMSYVGPKEFDAGEKTQYTNTAFVLLGMIAESVTKKTIYVLYKEMIWEPLGLTDIFLPGYESTENSVATAWLRLSDKFEPIEPLNNMSLLSIGYSAFGLLSNTKTIAKWGHTLFRDYFINESTYEEMLTFVPAAGNIYGESGAGLGIRKYNFLNREQYGHSGGSPLGSSLMLYDPTSEITVVVIMNQGRNAQHFQLAPKLLEVSSK
ncbi:class A beta-lactamase-related serine hydrolase [Flavobacteriaceae bacterium AU392]|nr:class A beta-lactamase-related serine hydrolase [Flavobacteriaceae bacterium]RKM85966.1 class A beta-lactamase-related serine hydrolase [Flavobacteriaceae bacterium AU392]